MVFSSIQASFRLFGPNHRKHLLTICNVLAFEPLRIVPQVLSKLDTTLCTLCKLGMAAMKAFLLRCRIRTYTVLRSQKHEPIAASLRLKLWLAVLLLHNNNTRIFPLFSIPLSFRPRTQHFLYTLNTTT